MKSLFPLLVFAVTCLVACGDSQSDSTAEISADSNESALTEIAEADGAEGDELANGGAASDGAEGDELTNGGATSDGAEGGELANGGATNDGTTNGGSSAEENGGSGEEPTTPKPIDPNHPHPEWATLEIDPELIVSQIEPDEYVNGIREALAHYGTKEDPIPISTDFLGGWIFDETQENPFPPHVNAIKEQYVIVKGFMLPDVDFEGITDFHLVRSLWGCCFGAPPRLNEMLRVQTPEDEGLRYTYNTLEVIGRLTVIFETEDGLINDLYRLSAESIVEGEFDDPLAPASFNPEEDLKGILPEMEF